VKFLATKKNKTTIFSPSSFDVVVGFGIRDLRYTGRNVRVLVGGS
jgi:hypothetical protein